MARECAAGKGRALVLRGGQGQGSGVSGNSRPAVLRWQPQGAHVSSCSLGSQLSTSRPLCSLGNTRGRPPLYIPKSQTFSPLG